MRKSAQLLAREFYDRDPTIVARQLLGKVLHRRTRQGQTSGIIVEVEAYLAAGDSASHSFRGATPRNASMFGPPGRLYVYPIHARYCLNAVTQAQGIASAVLIRSIEPIGGIPLMQSRRNRLALTDLCRGPARLCEALQVDRGLDGWDLTRGNRIWIEELDAVAPPDLRIGQTTRIGVTSAHDSRLRYFIDGSRFVSGPRHHHSNSSTAERST